MDFLSPEEYYKSLPKKQVGAGVLLFNSKGELLIVKPTYKDKWSIPGGSVDAEESPKTCAIRETKEEIGLDLKDVQFICVDYKKTKDVQPENMQFIFYGGIITEKEIKKIKLEKDELGEFRFISVEKNLDLLRPNFKKRLPHCLEAIKTGKTIYLEEGEIK